MCCTVLKCCCCIDLRAGTIVIACLCLFGSAVTLAWLSWGAYVFSAGANDIKNYMLQEEYDADDQEMVDIFIQATFWMMVIAAVVSALAVLLDIMLLAGAINGRRGLVQVWLIGYALIYCVFLLFCTIIIVAIFLGQRYYEGGEAAGGIGLHAALMVYFWVVVRSYHHALGHQYGDGGRRVRGRCTPGKVYSTVPTGDGAPTSPTTAGTYRYADEMPLRPTAPPHYVSSA